MNNYQQFMSRFGLIILCRGVCDSNNREAIVHTLHRYGILTIDDLRNTSIDTIRGFRTMGEKRIGFVEEMKTIIEDEEKTRDILNLDADYAALRDDPTLFERVKRLYSVLDCSVDMMSKISEFRKDTCLRIKYA